MTAKRKPKETKSYVVEYTITGCITVEATSKDEAERIFEKKFGDRGFATWEDGDMQITVEEPEAP
jgi:hypothetical protein